MPFPKLAIFDIDGTIAQKRVVSQEILDGFAYLQSQGCLTTVSTGRAYLRLHNVFGDVFDRVISEAAPIIVEHGTKIVDRHGSVLYADYFSTNEIEHIVDFIRANIGIVDQVWIKSADVTQKIQIWCSDEQALQRAQPSNDQYADTFIASVGKLRELLLAQDFSNVTVRLKPHVQVENLKLVLTRTELNLFFQDGLMEFVKSNTNKGLAVGYAAKTLGMHHDDILVAGNAINDIEMLDLPVGTAILVGQEHRATILEYMSAPDSIITVDSPPDLGTYLKNMRSSND